MEGELLQFVRVVWKNRLRQVPIRNCNRCQTKTSISRQRNWRLGDGDIWHFVCKVMQAQIMIGLISFALGWPRKQKPLLCFDWYTVYELKLRLNQLHCSAKIKKLILTKRMAENCPTLGQKLNWTASCPRYVLKDIGKSKDWERIYEAQSILTPFRSQETFACSLRTWLLRRLGIRQIKPRLFRHSVRTCAI